MPKIQIISVDIVKPADPADSNETAHTSLENPVLEIPISENSLNTFKNQVVFHVSDSAIKSLDRIEHPFDKKTRHNVTLRLRYFDEDHFNFLNYLKPNATYGILIPITFLIVFTTNFVAKSFRFARCTLFLEDVKTKDEQIMKIQYHHEKKTVHKGINETNTDVSRKYYWPNQKKDVNDYLYYFVCNVSENEIRETTV